jgi:hypothetical protein
MSIQTLYNLSSTLLLPSVYLVLVILLLHLLIAASKLNGFSDKKMSSDSCQKNKQPRQKIQNEAAGSKTMMIHSRIRDINPAIFYNSKVYHDLLY